MTRMIIIPIAIFARKLGLNINWIFAPITTFRRRESRTVHPVHRQEVARNHREE